MVKNMPNIVMDLITIMGFPGGSYGEESACNAGDLVPSLVMKIPWRRATHSSILAWRILMDRGNWQAVVHGVAKSWTQLSD